MYPYIEQQVLNDEASREGRPWHQNDLRIKMQAIQLNWSVKDPVKSYESYFHIEIAHELASLATLYQL